MIWAKYSSELGALAVGPVGSQNELNNRSSSTVEQVSTTKGGPKREVFIEALESRHFVLSV